MERREQMKEAARRLNGGKVYKVESGSVVCD